MGALAIVTLHGAVIVGLVWWLVHHVRREVLRRRQVGRVRAALAGRVSVAELRERCGEVTRYPTPSRAAGAPDPAALGGSTLERVA